MEIKHREYYLDTVGAILLIYMIVGHCCQWAHVKVFSEYMYWLGFFMPWFFFKGGMFYRKRTTREVIRVGYKRLIIPFLYFSLIGTIILWYREIILDNFSLRKVISPIYWILKDGSCPGNLALWFLPSLFFVRIIFNYFWAKMSKCKNLILQVLGGVVFTFVCLSFYLFSYIRDIYGIEFPYYFYNITSGLLFYALGYLMRDIKPSLKVSMILIILYLVIEIYLPLSVDMRSGCVNYGNFYLWIPYSILGIFSFNSIFRYIGNRKNILSDIGMDTMPYYCMHWCIIMLVSVYFTNITDTNYIYLYFLILTNIIFLPILTYFIKRSKYKYIFG